jgi:Amt family ammonium transporter
MKQHYNMSLVGNSVLAGCVSVTAGCATMPPWGAWVAGMIGALVYIGASKLLLRLRIDDPVDASALHGACGIWGVIATGIFSTDELAAFAGYVGSSNGYHPVKSGEQLGVQIVGALAITAWTVGTAGSMFLLMNYFNYFRVSPEIEDEGLDMPEHSVNAYELTDIKPESKNQSNLYVSVTDKQEA